MLRTSLTEISGNFPRAILHFLFLKVYLKRKRLLPLRPTRHFKPLDSVSETSSSVEVVERFWGNALQVNKLY